MISVVSYGLEEALKLNRERIVQTLESQLAEYSVG